MKTYQTWEAVKMLTEDPKLKFKLVGEETGYLTANSKELKHGFLCYADETKYPNSVLREISIEYEWKLVPQEVPFIEAIKAFSRGKTIYSITHGEKVTYNPKGINDRNLGLEDTNGNPISVIEILEWHWYIGED
jgi:hypothetical protein